MLLENHAPLAPILNSLEDPVIATDSQGAIVFMNPAADMATQWNHDEAIGVDWKDVFTVIPHNGSDVDETPVERAMRMAAC